MTKPKKLINPDTNEEFILPADYKEKIIGRAPYCDISVTASTVSGNHATIIHHKDGTVYLQDNKSTNNTYLIKNYGKKDEEVIDVREYVQIEKKRLQIFPNDVIRLGISDKSSKLQLISTDIVAEQKKREKQRLEDTVIEKN